MIGFIKIQVQRITQLMSLLLTLFHGLIVGYRIEFSKQPSRELLPKQIQIFSRKLGESLGVKVVSVEPIPQTHGLWVANHISWLDISATGSFAPVFFVSKAEVKKMFLIGTLAKLAGTLFVQRGSGDSGTVSDQIADFLRSGASVILFPEATTTNGHKMKKIHGKLLRSAMQTQLPIQPLVICYANKDGTISEEATYCGDISIKDSLKNVLDAKDVTAYVMPLEPIFPEDKTQDEITAILAQQMQAGLTKLQKQVLTTKPEGAIWDDESTTAPLTDQIHSMTQ